MACVAQCSDSVWHCSAALLGAPFGISSHIPPASRARDSSVTTNPPPFNPPPPPPPPLSRLNDHSGRGTSHHTTCSLPTCKALQIEKVAHDQGPQCIHQGCCSCTPPLPAPRGSTARSRGQCSVNKKRLPWEGINSGTVALRDCVLSLSTLEDDSYEPANCGLKQSSP